MNKTKKLTLTSLIIAITTISSHLVFIPVGFAKIFPIQHFANVLLAVLLGPWYAVGGALIVSTLRNLLGTGSIFAYPGSVIGALLAGIFYMKTKNLGYAFVGEVIGTGILGALATYPIGVLLFGKEMTVFGLVPAFMFSSFTGALLAFGLLKVMMKNRVLGEVLNENSAHDSRI